MSFCSKSLLAAARASGVLAHSLNSSKDSFPSPFLVLLVESHLGRSDAGGELLEVSLPSWFVSMKAKAA